MHVDLSPGDGRGYKLLPATSAPLAEMNDLVKKSVVRMSQPRVTLSLCICANQGPVIRAHNHNSSF